MVIQAQGMPLLRFQTQVLKNINSSRELMLRSDDVWMVSLGASSSGVEGTKKEKRLNV